MSDFQKPGLLNVEDDTLDDDSFSESGLMIILVGCDLG